MNSQMTRRNGHQPMQAQQQRSDPFTVFANIVKANRKDLQQIVPDGFDLKRLYQIFVSCMMKNPALSKCTPDSIFRSMMQCAELALEPNSPLGEAYLIPYKDECTLIVGYRGLINLARRSGFVQTIQAEAVYEGDFFDYSFGLNDRLEHKPCGENNPDKIHCVWAVAKFKDGSYQFTVMPRAEVDKIRARSKAGNNGPWITDYSEMAKKTALRRLAKYLPMSVQMAKGVEISDHNEFGDGIEVKFLDNPMEDDITDPAPNRQAAIAPPPLDPPVVESAGLRSFKGWMKSRELDFCPEFADSLVAFALKVECEPGIHETLSEDEWKTVNSVLVKTDRAVIAELLAAPGQEQPSEQGTLV